MGTTSKILSVPGKHTTAIHEPQPHPAPTHSLMLGNTPLTVRRDKEHRHGGSHSRQGSQRGCQCEPGVYSKTLSQHKGNKKKGKEKETREPDGRRCSVCTELALDVMKLGVSRGPALTRP